MSKIKEILSELLEYEVTDRSDLAGWYALAEELYKEHKNTKSELPELVWHYLSDADVRLKEPQYGAEQIQAVKEYIAGSN